MHIRSVLLAGFAILALVGAAIFSTWRLVAATGPDVNNDGHVRIDDVLDVLHHYFEDVPTQTPTATATPTETPAPTPTRLPYDVSFYGPATASVGEIVSYSIAVRNVGSESADVHINSFGAMTLSNDPSVFTPLCVYTGTSPGTPAQACGNLDDFNLAGVNGLGFGGTVTPGDAIWATFTGHFNTPTDQLPFIAETTWHYSGNAIAASGNQGTVVRVCC